jgi:hypothetical protein
LPYYAGPCGAHQVAVDSYLVPAGIKEELTQATTIVATSVEVAGVLTTQNAELGQSAPSLCIEAETVVVDGVLCTGSGSDGVRDLAPEDGQSIGTDGTSGGDLVIRLVDDPNTAAQPSLVVAPEAKLCTGSGGNGGDANSFASGNESASPPGGDRRRDLMQTLADLEHGLVSQDQPLNVDITLTGPDQQLLDSAKHAARDLVGGGGCVFGVAYCVHQCAHNPGVEPACGTIDGVDSCINYVADAATTDSSNAAVPFHQDVDCNDLGPLVSSCGTDQVGLRVAGQGVCVPKPTACGSGTIGERVGGVDACAGLCSQAGQVGVQVGVLAACVNEPCGGNLSSCTGSCTSDEVGATVMGVRACAPKPVACGDDMIGEKVGGTNACAGLCSGPGQIGARVSVLAACINEPCGGNLSSCLASCPSGQTGEVVLGVPACVDPNPCDYIAGPVTANAGDGGNGGQLALVSNGGTLDIPDGVIALGQGGNGGDAIAVYNAMRSPGYATSGKGGDSTATLDGLTLPYNHASWLSESQGGNAGTATVFPCDSPECFPPFDNYQFDPVACATGIGSGTPGADGAGQGASTPGGNGGPGTPATHRYVYSYPASVTCATTPSTPGGAGGDGRVVFDGSATGQPGGNGLLFGGKGGDATADSAKGGEGGMGGRGGDGDLGDDSFCTLQPCSHGGEGGAGSNASGASATGGSGGAGEYGIGGDGGTATANRAVGGVGGNGGPGGIFQGSTTTFCKSGCGGSGGYSIDVTATPGSYGPGLVKNGQPGEASKGGPPAGIKSPDGIGLGVVDC